MGRRFPGGGVAGVKGPVHFDKVKPSWPGCGPRGRFQGLYGFWSFRVVESELRDFDDVQGGFEGTLAVREQTESARTMIHYHETQQNTARIARTTGKALIYGILRRRCRLQLPTA